MPNIELDAADIRILRLLQEDSAQSNVELAARISLSPSPTLARVRSLEARGQLELYAQAIHTLVERFRSVPALLALDGDILQLLESPDDQALRQQLSDRYAFQTGSDCEVILALYQEKGPDFLDDLQGMFAFALWDNDRRVLYLVRDRLGKKPLAYTTDADGLAFASEPKAFLADPAFECRPNPEALWH